ncbi:MAG: thioredoxin domain-containing protein, partial [Actinobacteria bacterium]|nr:thioredoxin domain-containing protein [Actinomycetota bacterium]
MTLHFSPRPNRAAEIAWRTWGPDAFEEAEAQDRPILLSISAVWCHWCHVMDETSYSDDQVIQGINERFIPIRVDNDERPDVNRRYNMGGWPTTAFLTPDGEIIHGGTYVPPEQMRSYVQQVADVWRDKRAEIAERVRGIQEHEHERKPQEPGDLTWDIVETVGSLVRGQYDPQFGGFGRDQKFPQPHLVRFVLDEHRRHGYPELATMLHKTLVAMAAGGMYDQVEGGFFRYSTTREWTIPHYEKMLEDNAELLLIYAEAHRSFPQAGYDRVVRDVVRWMDT